MSNPNISKLLTNDTEVVTIDGSNDSIGHDTIDGYSRFLIYLKSAIEDMSSSVSEDMFCNYLKLLSITKNSRSVPGKMQKKMSEGIKNSLLSEIEETIKEENIKENIKQLEKLKEESMLQEGLELWRPSGNVKDDMRSHLMAVKQKGRQKLEKVVRDKEQDLECILTKVVSLRTHLRSMESRLQILNSQCEDSAILENIDKKISNAIVKLEQSNECRTMWK